MKAGQSPTCSRAQQSIISPEYLWNICYAPGTPSPPYPHELAQQETWEVGLAVLPISRCGNGGRERLGKLPKVTQPVRGETRIRTWKDRF